MAYNAKILLDSIGPSKKRITTFELTYPRFVHSEFMTHRMLSKNSASSRAIPIEKMIKRIEEDPVEPVWFGVNQAGMQAEREMEPAEKQQFLLQWHAARKDAISYAKAMSSPKVNAHKQIVNRILEPWMWITVVATATEYGNLWHLRTDRNAQPEIRKIIEMACEMYYTNTPRELEYGEWHLPLVLPEELEGLNLVHPVTSAGIDFRYISAARCARTSYLTHGGRRDLDDDMKLFKRLIEADPGHWSPLEHPARALSNPISSGNFFGWAQLRKEYAQENRPHFDGAAWLTKKASPV